MKKIAFFLLIFTSCLAFSIEEFGVYFPSHIGNSNIEQTIVKIKEMGFNAIILPATDEFVEDGKSVAFFPNSVLPLAEGVEENYFENVIKIAHQKGLKVYAWINMPNEYFLSLHPDWISILSNGKPSDYYNSNDYFQRIIPPARVIKEDEYKNLLASLIDQLVSYNIDGIDLNDNFQWAEYYIENQDLTLYSSFDNFSVEAFESDTGINVEGNSPEEKADYIFNNEEIYNSWLEWRANQVNRLLEFIKNRIVKSGKSIPFRPHLLADKWALEDYGIDYQEACKIADIPYTMILVDSNEHNLEKYNELIFLIKQVSAKKIACSTYLYDIESNSNEELLKRILLFDSLNINSLNLFNLNEIEEKNLFNTVKYAISRANTLSKNKTLSSRMGVHIVGLEGEDSQTIDNTLKKASLSGAKWVRIGAIWDMLNPEKDKFNFENEDLLINTLKKYNLNPLIAVAWCPKWVSSNPNAPDYYFYAPTDEKIGDYQSPFSEGSGYDYLYLFAKTLAERYKDSVFYYELWNEEDTDFLKSVNSSDTSAEYAKMLFYFYHGIKDGNPDAKVLIGGLAQDINSINSHPNYLEKLLRNTNYPAFNNFDILNIHTNYKTPSQIVNQIEMNKNILKDYGNKPLWITETCYSSEKIWQNGEFKQGEEGLVNYLKKTIPLELGLTDGVVFWTPFADYPENIENCPEKYSGIVYKNLKEKNLFYLFKNIANSKPHTFVIPHIAEKNWHTTAKIFNESGKECYLTLKKYESGKLKIEKPILINPLEAITLTNNEFGKNGFVLVNSFSNSIHINLSFRYKDTKSVSSFNLNEKSNSKWIIPVKQPDWFDWSGIAIANHLNEKINLNITAYKNGEKISEFNTTLNPYSKFVSTLKNIFLNDTIPDFLIVSSNREIYSPIFISGNNSQTRHLFLKGQLMASGTFYLNHIAEENWETSVELINPSNYETKIILTGKRESKTITIPPYSKIALKSGSELDFSSLYKIESNNAIMLTLYYRFKGRQSICAFPIKPDNLSKHFLINNKFENWFDWSGLAIANFNSFPVKIYLSAYKGKEKVGDNLFELNQFSKNVKLVSNFIQGLTPENFDKIELKSNYPIPAPIIISGNNEQDRHTFFNGEKLKSKRFPQIANYFLGDVNESDITPLSQMDLIVLDMETGNAKQDILKSIKKINPEIKILGYMTAEEIETDSPLYDENSLRYKLWQNIKDSWWLKNCNGEHIVFWEDTWMLNCSSLCPEVNGKKWNTTFAEFIVNNVLSCKLWDGFYVDNCWDNISWIDECIDINGDSIGDNTELIDNSWKDGMDEMLARFNSLTSNSLFMGNGGYAFYKYLNGALIEEFTEWDNWYNEVNTYRKLCNLMKKPVLNTINACGGENDLKKMRFGLASALISDGYYSYDAGSQTHSEHWIYPEYLIDLGVPLDDGEIVIENPVLTNDFENNSWETNEFGEITENGIDGKSILADSTNSTDEWNEFLFSPSNSLTPENEIIVKFDYKILEKQENTEFYFVIRSKSQSENYDLNIDKYFGKNSPILKTSTFKTSCKLKNANDYQIVFGIKNRGKTLIDNIKVYSDTNTMYSIRYFENGVAICNNSQKTLNLPLNGMYKTIDSLTNQKGKANSTVSIPPKEGIILLKAP
ncbi:hypothetical protein TTHT_0165 [Thermotomaculum hydrothermale]|uniref:Glycosyl hydrolase-like 10 domain-containing protein n=1 Tax=Thermotomaculum hydrothermale TaxID=981385 RepID=A0A7R6PDL8_9BACT|nr:putative glycoside hydrolase [Thermotomaculum hydrothermale]BBB31804.1 hypothetical protein TTHT_0165 [Thermotomaculum hydrothermale]